MASLAGVYATLGLMSFTFPVKIWCSKGEDSASSDSSQSFYLYSRVEGEEVEGFSEIIEGTVQAVASEYFGTGVVFERCTTQGLDRNSFNKWKITEVPISGTPMSVELELALKQKHFALNYGLSPPQLDDLFPFHIVFDSSLNIVNDLCQLQSLVPRLLTYLIFTASVTSIPSLGKRFNPS
jgi:hypothetical protein